MNNAQFSALAQLLRMRGGASQEVARLVLVDGKTVVQASKTTGLDLRLAHRSVKNARAGLALAHLAASAVDQ
jgi:hypothetical protein